MDFWESQKGQELAEIAVRTLKKLADETKFHNDLLSRQVAAEESINQHLSDLVMLLNRTDNRA